MKFRKVKNKLLLKSGIVYRIIVICANALFFQLGVRAAITKFGAIGASLIWNTINMCLYYLYHFTFAKLFKIGREDEV